MQDHLRERFRKRERRVTVRVSFNVDIDVPDEWDENDIRFYVEENHCPGTGIVGSAVGEIVAKTNAIIEKSDREHICWACGAADGENKIVSIEGMEYEAT